MIHYNIVQVCYSMSTCIISYYRFRRDIEDIIAFAFWARGAAFQTSEDPAPVYCYYYYYHDDDDHSHYYYYYYYYYYYILLAFEEMLRRYVNQPVIAVRT